MELKINIEEDFLDLIDTEDEYKEELETSNKLPEEEIHYYNFLKDDEIYELYVSDNSIHRHLTNERLVEMIQNGYDVMWEVLYKKTKNSIYKVYHKSVNAYYKATMKDDIMSVLEFGWSKSVLEYDKEKATAPFVAFASYIMWQQYAMLVRKIKKDRIGKSVRHEYLENATVNSSQKNMGGNSGSMTNNLVQNILLDENDYFAKQENLILLKEGLQALKEEKEDLYELVRLHYLKGIPQTQIAEMNNHGQSYISRKIKQAVKFLRDYMLIKSKGNLEDLKVEMLSSFK